MSEPVQGHLEATEASRQGPNLPWPFPARGCLLRATLAGSGDENKGPLDVRICYQGRERVLTAEISGFLVSGFHASLFCARARPARTQGLCTRCSRRSSTFPRGQHGFLLALCSGASSVSASEGAFPDLLTPSPHPCILPFPSDDPHHHLRSHSGICPSLSCIFHEDSGLAYLGMSGHLSRHFLVSVSHGPSLSLSQADLVQALRRASWTVRPDVAFPCSTNAPGM